MPVSTPEHRTSLVCAVLALSGEALMEVDGDDVTSALERVAEINGLSTRLTWTYGQAMHIAFKFDADAVYRKDFGEKERELVPSRFNPAVCEGETFIIATFDIETCKLRFSPPFRVRHTKQCSIIMIELFIHFPSTLVTVFFWLAVLLSNTRKLIIM